MRTASILTLLAALPLGYLVRPRLAAHLAYGLGFTYIFTFQTLTLLLAWSAGSDAAFDRDGDAPLDYLLVTTAIYAAGFGLVTLGHWLRGRRTGRVTGVDLEQARG
jgi:hypothetical protein